MLFSYSTEITKAYIEEVTGQPTPPPKGKKPKQDAVLTVPMFYTQAERVALTKSAALGNLNVLSLIEENTAAALHYGMDRIEEEPKIVLFYNLGGMGTQVSIVKFYSWSVKAGKDDKKVGGFEVIGKGWDATLGGGVFDKVIVDYLAGEFNKKWGKGNVLEVPRAVTKLRIQATKVKEVLSANTNVPIYIESLHDDTDFKSELSRDKFEVRKE